MNLVAIITDWPLYPWICRLHIEITHSNEQMSTVLLKTFRGLYLCTDLTLIWPIIGYWLRSDSNYLTIHYLEHDFGHWMLRKKWDIHRLQWLVCIDTHDSGLRISLNNNWS